MEGTESLGSSVIHFLWEGASSEAVWQENQGKGKDFFGAVVHIPFGICRVKKCGQQFELRTAEN